MLDDSLDDLFRFEEPVALVPRATGPSAHRDTDYDKLILGAFFRYWTPGMEQFVFSRKDIDGSALGLSPANIGDCLYTFRHRRTLPQAILDSAPDDRVWMIEGAGRGRYRFVLVKQAFFDPSPAAPLIRLLDHSLPEARVKRKRKFDEQAILTTMRQNRMLDLALHARLTHVQAHARMSVTGIGQIEIDDVFLGVSGKTGKAIVVTVQGKRNGDRINASQILQDIRACQEHEDGLIPVPCAVHYDTASGRFAVMEFTERDGEVVLVNEQHFILVHETIN